MHHKILFTHQTGWTQANIATSRQTSQQFRSMTDASSLTTLHYSTHSNTTIKADNAMMVGEWNTTRVVNPQNSMISACRTHSRKWLWDYTWWQELMEHSKNWPRKIAVITICICMSFGILIELHWSEGVALSQSSRIKLTNSEHFFSHSIVNSKKIYMFE